MTGRFALTVIATTGEEFSDFAPYVASVNDAGTVALQAALDDGRTGVFTGRGAVVVGPSLVARVTSHPDVNNAGDMSFYGDLPNGRQAVFFIRDRELRTIASTGERFVSIGPLGPTMNEVGAVAFRADGRGGASGIFVGDDASVTTIADTDGPWSRFHGLPVITGDGTVVFRADRKDGVGGIYARRDESMRTVAETGGEFESLGLFPSANDRGVVAFAATPGVFTADEDRVMQIAGTDGPFESCRGALIADDGAVVIIATPWDGTLGLFAGPDPKADRILAAGDPLLGSTVTELRSNPVSVAVGHVAIAAILTDGRQVILRADTQ